MPAARIQALIAKLEKGQCKTQEIFSQLSVEQWQTIVYQQPYPWSVRDMLAHFVSAETDLRRLAQDVAAGGPGVPQDFDYDAHNAKEQARLADQSPKALLIALHQARQATLDWVRTLPEDALDKVGWHPGLGQVSLETMITAMYGHQLLHMRDFKRAL